MPRRKPKPSGLDIEVVSVDPSSADFAASRVAEVLKGMGYRVKGPNPLPGRHGPVPAGQRVQDGSGFARLHARQILVQEFVHFDDAEQLNATMVPQGPDVIVRYLRPSSRQRKVL